MEASRSFETSSSRRSACPLCGEISQYGKELIGGKIFYVIQCPGCRELRISSTFLLSLWDRKQSERRAMGRLLSSHRVKYGPSLVLEPDWCRTLVKELPIRGLTPIDGL